MEANVRETKNLRHSTLPNKLLMRIKRGTNRMKMFLATSIQPRY